MKSIGLVPELSCSDIEKSLKFYTGILGFTILYERKEENFAYLKKGNAEIMLEQPGRGRVWRTGDLEYPFGRGINFQIETDAIDDLYASVNRNRTPLFLAIEEKWYRRDSALVGHKQFLIQDPDGYLLRFYQDLGIKQV